MSAPHPVPDPAETLSGGLPSLPPAPRDDRFLDALDSDFPIRLSEPAHIFWRLTGEWEDRETVITQTIRATQQHDAGGGFSEERFVQPLHHTLPIPAITAPAAPPVVYPDLTEPVLAHEWDTGPGTAILTEPRRHRRRDSNGRFAAAVTPRRRTQAELDELGAPPDAA